MRLPRLGRFVQVNAGWLLISFSSALLLLCVALKSAKLDDQLTSWVQRNTNVDGQLGQLAAEGARTSSLLLSQTQRRPKADLLTVEALMVHLEALAIAAHTTVDLYDVTWSLKDICFLPTLPDHGALLVTQILDQIMPCAIKTPLDCFWEGSKLLGPEQSVPFGSLGPMIRWTSLNPLKLVEDMQPKHPSAAFPYQTLIDWMHRVGITSGYQQKPCLDPSDPNCPLSAPNKLASVPPNIGFHLSDGCHGVASKQMHWHQEELVGGAIRNASGYIVKASALQSTIQLMGEQDMYDYWRKTSKVQDINNWSADKAKAVLDSWQQQFKSELDNFSKTSPSTSSYRLHAITPQSMLQPISINTLLDLTSFLLCFILMTIISCISFPSLSLESAAPARSESKIRDRLTKHMRTSILAIVTSSLIGLIFVASLGLSSFMNLPLNLATTQILPPFALYHAFNQFTMIANLYSHNLDRVSPGDLTSECIMESIPIIMVDSMTNILMLLAASIFPIPATRVFAFQAIIFIILSSAAALFLMPPVLVTFLRYFSQETEISCDQELVPRARSKQGSAQVRIRENVKLRPREDSSIEDQILARIQNDLRNIQAEKQIPTDFHFSSQLGTSGLRTSLHVTSRSKPRFNPHNNASGMPPPYQETSSRSHIMSTQKTQPLPDLLANALPDYNAPNATPTVTERKSVQAQDIVEQTDQQKPAACKWKFIDLYLDCTTKSKTTQILICLLKLATLVAIILYAPGIKHDLQLIDIVARGTEEYESFSLQQEYFPLHNVFIVIKGNYDYPANQKQLYEFHRAIENVDGILKTSDSSKPKFWLPLFRDWLLELQERFDVDRNKSSINAEGWSMDASDAAKLAYKLLAQTGKPDNPVDKNLVMVNRLVDANGIINPKAFYHYLTAWVMNDAFTYSTSEANFKPEPKTWNENPDDLRVERAKPLSYAQIPFLMKLPANHENFKTITNVRKISQAFVQLNLPNLPTGIPFVFWDQFNDLDALSSLSLMTSIFLILLVVGLSTSDFRIAIIVTAPMVLTALELYFLISHLSIPFNNILSVLLISTLGTSTLQTIHYLSYFGPDEEQQSSTWAREAICNRFRMVITSLSLFCILTLSFSHSHFNFMINFSRSLLCMAIIHSVNSTLLTPILTTFYSPQRPCHTDSHTLGNVKTAPIIHQSRSTKSKSKFGKRRTYPRVQSEISLSTISEEPQAEALDLKFDLSIKCY